MMRKMLVLFLVLVLSLAPTMPAVARNEQPLIGQEDTVLFASGFETGNFYDWDDLEGNQYDIDILNWWQCPVFTGYYCARTGAYGAGQKAYLVDRHPNASHSNLKVQWDADDDTHATIEQPAVIFRFVTDTGIAIMELRTYLDTATDHARVRLACRDFDDPLYMKYSPYITIPWATKFQVGWNRGPAGVGGCSLDLFSVQTGQRIGGTRIIRSTGNWNPGKFLIGNVTNPGPTVTEHHIDNYSDHSL